MEGSCSDACIAFALSGQFHRSFGPFVWSQVSLCLEPEFPRAGIILIHELLGGCQRQRKAFEDLLEFFHRFSGLPQQFVFAQVLLSMIESLPLFEFQHCPVHQNVLGLLLTPKRLLETLLQHAAFYQRLSDFLPITQSLLL